MLPRPNKSQNLTQIDCVRGHMYAERKAHPTVESNRVEWN